MLRVTCHTLHQSSHQAPHGVHVNLVKLDWIGAAYFIQDLTEIYSFGLLAADESLSSLDAMSVRITDRHDIRELRELFSKTVRAIGNRCPLIPTTAATDNGHAGAIIRVLKTDGPSRPLGDARSGGKQG